MLALSWAAAFVACLGYGVGSVLQSVGARRVSAGGGVTGVALILLQLPYLLGLGADVLAFLANVVAVQRLPLFLVQSILTASVGVTAVLAALRGDRLGRRDWVALGVLGLGLVLLCLTATSGGAVALAPAAQWLVLALGCVAPLALGLLGTRLGRRAAPLVLAAAAGLAWTAVAVASRGLSADPVGWALLGRPLLWGVVLQGVVGTVFFALALQRGSVTAVTAVTFALEMLLPSALGLWLLGDGVGAGQAPVAALGFVLAAGGTVSLMRFAE